MPKEGQGESGPHIPRQRFFSYWQNCVCKEWMSVGQSWFSVTRVADSKPPQFKWTAADERARRNCQDPTEWEVWMCNISAEKALGRWPLGPVTERLLILGVWLGHCTTRCFCTFTPQVNHATVAITGKTLYTLRTGTRKKSPSFQQCLSIALSWQSLILCSLKKKMLESNWFS